MRLLTKGIRNKLPGLYSQEKKEAKDVKIIVKFFNPAGSWSWYATEFDGVDTFFGLVDGFEKELGYFSLKELEGFRGSFGLGIERDLHFKNKTLAEVL